MQRNVLLAALVVMLAAVFVWLLRDQNDSTSVAATARGTHPTELGERDSPAIFRDETRTESAQERSAVAEADTRVTSEVRENDAATPATIGDLLEVRVIDRTSRKPVSGARVVRFESPEHDPAFDIARVLRRGDFDASFDSDEHAQITDTGGVVHFPRARDVTVLAARFENMLAFASAVPDSPKPILIELVADGDIAVRVVDALGRAAAGVPIALRRGGAGLFNDYSLAETDAQGRATLRHALALVSARPKPALWSVALRGVFDPPIKVDVDAAIQAGATAQLVLRAHGACEVEVLDEQGALCTQRLSIGLRVLRDERQTPTQGWYVSEGGLRFEDVTTGRQLFGFVQLGSALEAFVTRDGSEVVHRAPFSGLVSTDQRARITLKLAETACVLTGRVLDESGQPLSNVAVRARTQRDYPRGTVDFAESALALDAQGRFRFDIDVSREPTPHSFVVYTCDAGEHEQFSVARDLPSPLALGVQELGDLTLERSPLVAAGVVLDHRGQSVAGAKISVAVMDLEETQPSWNELDLPEVKTDAQGRFDIRAHIVLPEIEVSAAHDGRTSKPVTVQPGSSDLILRFDESGGIAGRVLLDEALGKGNALIEVRCTDALDDEESPPSRHVMLDKNSEFEFRGLRVGTWEVRVNTPTNWIPLTRIAGVVVTSEGMTRDPRLDPLDLRGQLLSFTLRLVDAHDAPVPQSWLVVHRADLGDETFDDSKALGNMIKHGVVCGLAGVDVRAGAPGMRDVEMHAVKSNTTIVLALGPRVRLHLAQPAPVSAPFELGLQLLPDGESRPSIASKAEPTRFDLDGVAHVTSPVVGRTRVQFVLLHLRGRDGLATAEVQSKQSQVIDIRDDPGEQSFEISFDPVDLEAAQRQISSR